MSERIIYTRPDGGVSVVVPMQEFLARFPSAGAGMLAVKARSVPLDATDVKMVEADDVPSDRTFRNAWRQSGGVFSTDMPAAREIHAECIERCHTAEIERLKVTKRRERIKGNTTQADAHVATQTALEALDLNALATRIGNAPNPTALKAIWPANVPR